MSNKAIISAGQMAGASRDKKENVLRILDLMKEAEKQGVDVVCFGELSLSPYFAIEPNREYLDIYFDNIPNDLTKEIFRFTEKNHLAIVLPYAETDGVHFFNTAAFIANGQIVGKYRKVHMPGAFLKPGEKLIGNYEKIYFATGNLGFPVYEMNGVKVGVQICYDRHFPEGYRCLTLKGAQVVFNPTALPDRGLAWRRVTWEPFLKVRAFENGIFVVGVNKAGIEGDIEFMGQSIVLSPIGGDVLAKAKTDQDELVTCEIDLDDINEARKILPWNRDRRPENYNLLIE